MTNAVICIGFKLRQANPAINEHYCTLLYCTALSASRPLPQAHSPRYVDLCSSNCIRLTGLLPLPLLLVAVQWLTSSIGDRLADVGLSSEAVVTGSYVNFILGLVVATVCSDGASHLIPLPGP